MCSGVSAVARVVGQLRVGASVAGRVPDVQVHVGAEGVEVGVMFGWAGGARLTVERCVGGVWRNGGRAVWLEMALVRLSVRSPDRTKQAGGDGRETTSA